MELWHHDVQNIVPQIQPIRSLIAETILTYAAATLEVVLCFDYFQCSRVPDRLDEHAMI